MLPGSTVDALVPPVEVVVATPGRAGESVGTAGEIEHVPDTGRVECPALSKVVDASAMSVPWRTARATTACRTAPSSALRHSPPTKS